MRTAFNLFAVATLLAVTPDPCFALWDLEVVSRERAAELDVQVRSTKAGPHHVRVELEFAAAGELANFSQVDLRLGRGDNPTLTAPLQEDRSKPGRVVVHFTADSAELDTLTLRVLVPFRDGGAGGTIHEVRVQDFVLADDRGPAVDVAEPAPGAAEFRFDGTWKPKGAMLGGVLLPPPALAAITLVIAKETYEVTIEGEDHSDKGTFTLDESTTPKRMTIKSQAGPNRGKTFLAIYEVKDANAMRVCYDLSGQAFPKEFKAPKGTELYLVGYRRHPTAPDAAPAAPEASPEER